jgi:hypothetical protein
MNEMKKLLRRTVAAALTLLLAVALAPCPSFADAPGATSAKVPETAPSTAEAVNPASDDPYEYDPDAPWLYYDMTEEEYYEEFEPWRLTGQTEEEYWDEYWKNYDANKRTERLRDFGFTDTEIPNVVVNGEPLNFTGAKPLVRGGATMIPARAVFEALGAEVAYDEKAKTVTVAKDDATVVFTVGSDTARVARDGRTEEIALSAAPFVNGRAAYVPLRASTEALGFEVYWNGYYKIAEVIDKAALVAEIDAKFKVFNALLRSEQDALVARRESGKAERMDVDFAVDADARYNPEYYGTDERSKTVKGDAKLAGDFTVLSDENGFDVSGDAKLEINGFEDIIGEIDQDFELKELLADLKKGMPFDLIVDYEETSLKLPAAYLRLPLLSYLEPLLDKHTWIVWRAEDFDIGVDFQEIRDMMSFAAEEENLTLGALLYWSAVDYRPMPDNLLYDFDRGESLLLVARVLEPFLGDAYMKKNGDVHEISLNRLELFNIARKLSEEGDFFDVGDYAEFLATVPAANYALRIGTTDGTPSSMEIAVNVKFKLESYSDEEDGYMEFHYNANAAPQKASVDYSISISDSGPFEEGSFHAYAGVVYAQTDETPRTAPPAGSKVVSADDL